MTKKKFNIEEKTPSEEMSKKEYLKELKKLHIELVRLQRWVVHKGLRVCIVFEGRDGAGKGGAIKAITERVSPRVFRVVALPAPSDREKTQMYMRRYIRHMPAAGEIVIFDRSWYNRAGVERVMGFCTDKEAERFLKDIPFLERAITDSGIILLKYWMEVSPDEQEKRLRDRVNDERKVWKLSPMDVKSFALWDEYTKARDEMFEKTDTSWGAWFVVNSDNKEKARLNLIRHILDQIPHKKIPLEEVKFPKRKVSASKSMHEFKYVQEKY